MSQVAPKCGAGAAQECSKQVTQVAFRNGFRNWPGGARDGFQEWPKRGVAEWKTGEVKEGGRLGGGAGGGEGKNEMSQ